MLFSDTDGVLVNSPDGSASVGEIVIVDADAVVNALLLIIPFVDITSVIFGSGKQVLSNVQY